MVTLPSSGYHPRNNVDSDDIIAVIYTIYSPYLILFNDYYLPHYASITMICQKKKKQNVCPSSHTRTPLFVKFLSRTTLGHLYTPNTHSPGRIKYTRIRIPRNIPNSKLDQPPIRRSFETPHCLPRPEYELPNYLLYRPVSAPVCLHDSTIFTKRLVIHVS